MKKIILITTIIFSFVILNFSVFAGSSNTFLKANKYKDINNPPLIDSFYCQLLDQNGSPLKDITFIFENNQKIAVTDKNGIFSFSFIEEGNHPIVATDFSGHILIEINLIVSISDKLNITSDSDSFKLNIKNENSSIKLKAVYNTETEKLTLADPVINPETKDYIWFDFIFMIIFISSTFIIFLFVSEKFKKFRMDI